MYRFLTAACLLVVAAFPAGAAPQKKPCPGDGHGKLLIHGGQGEGQELFIEKGIALCGNKNVRVVIVPYAFGEPNMTDPDTVAAAASVIRRWTAAGAAAVTRLDLRDQRAALAAVSAADYIFFYGGDQATLVRWMNRYPVVMEAIRTRRSEGALIGGESAGAAMMSRDMILGGNHADLKAVRPQGTKLVPGLGFWPDVIVDQHFMERQRWARLLSAVLDHPSMPGVGIDESSAILVGERDFEVVGDTGVIVFDARHARVQPGEPGRRHSAAGVVTTLLRAGDRFDWHEGKILLPSGTADGETPSVNSAATPCVRADQSCAGWISLDDHGTRSRYFGSFPLSVRNDRVRRALVMVHGMLRNGDSYFATASSAAFLANAQDDTIVIAPVIASADGECKDSLDTGEVSWACSGDSWKTGGNATNHPGLTSFDLMDRIVTLLSDKSNFPALSSITIAGHSAGGQFVSRYAMSNRKDGTITPKLSYVVANPSSYAWPDGARPLPVKDATPDTAMQAWRTEEVHTDFQFAHPAGTGADGYDDWPYGLRNRKGGYTFGMSDDQLRQGLASRSVTYLLGQIDTLPLSGFDTSPAAMMQGPTRRARGEAFVQYVNTRSSGRGTAMVVPGCGHNARCVFTTDEVLPIIFPDDR